MYTYTHLTFVSYKSNTVHVMGKSVFDTISTKTEKPKKPTLPFIQVPSDEEHGDIVAAYAEACDNEKRASAIKEALSPKLVSLGLASVFKRNCDKPTERTSSVNLVTADESLDETVDNSWRERVQFSWTEQNLSNDPAAVLKGLGALKDVNGDPVEPMECVEWKIGATFDTSVFEVDGKFNEARAKRVIAALDILADELKIPNPVSFVKTLVPKAEFTAKRFEKFDYKTNLKIFTILPNKTTLKAIRPVPAKG